MLHKRKKEVGMASISMAIGLLVIVLATATTLVAAQSIRHCRESCGDVKVPYPFGMDKDCYLGEKFLITCNESFKPPKAFLMESNIPVINISLDGELSVMHYIARDCYDKQGKRNEIISRAATFGVPLFSISSTRNKFVAIGCDTNAFVLANGVEERYATGCISFCNSTRSFNNSCSGAGCCETSIASGLKNISVVVNSYYNHTGIWGFNPCSYAFVVEESKFKFSSSFFHQLENIEKVPMVINWAVGDDESERCHEAEKKANFTCKANSECLNVNDGSGGYRCRCLGGYQGNPYHPDGCQDIDECENSNPCDPGMCHNIPGSWKCTCPKGYKNSGKRCPKKDTTDQSGRLLLLYIVLGVILLLLVVISMTYWGTKEIKMRKLKEKFFEQNGGLMLQQRVSKFETAKIFTEEELKRATNNYNQNRVIGEGGQGKVYKGILPDNQEVAIKKSKIGDKTQTGQFINEVITLLQINHRNVVKLLGCCLETEVPLLVYQFINNGTLFEHLHYKGNAPALPWKLRLKIASETAGVLAYLHSATSTPIIHRDVKSTNMLDGNYTAKVSDFGASRLIPLDQTQMKTLVQGTLGYLDPEYVHSSQLTEKSDVYSFGVVLAELLTSKKPVSFDRPEGERNLAIWFTAVEENCLLDVLDGKIVDEKNVEELKQVASLAKRCLNAKGQERPTMKVVVNELEGLINFEKISWGKVDLCKEEKEDMHGSGLNTYEGTEGECSLGSGASSGYDSIQNQMQKTYNDGR